MLRPKELKMYSSEEITRLFPIVLWLQERENEKREEKSKIIKPCMPLFTFPLM